MTYKEYYHLRCTNRNCLGTAKYNIENGKTIYYKYYLQY